MVRHNEPTVAEKKHVELNYTRWRTDNFPMVKFASITPRMRQFYMDVFFLFYLLHLVDRNF